MEQERDTIITFRGCTWLLLFVFYLQFLVAEVLEMNWSFVSDGPVPQSVTIIAIQLFAVAVPCGLFLLLHSAKPAEVLKLRKLRSGGTITCVMMGIAAQPVASLCNLPMVLHRQSAGIATTPIISTPQTGGELLVGLVVIALLPAIFEEILMRGIVLHSLEQQGYRGTMFISALLFALLHNRLEAFWGVFFLGLVLCYAVWMTQSVFAGMIVHFSFNAFGMLLDFGISQNLAAHPWLGGQAFHICLIVVAVLLLGATTSAINRRTVRRYRTQHFWKQVGKAVFNVPVLLIILGCFMFDFLFRFMAA